MIKLKEILNESSKLFEDNELFEADSENDKMTEEDLKIESLKIATNIAKLMSDVTTDDILTIATKVADFIRNHEIKKEESNVNL